MFGDEILNGKELRQFLRISTTIYYQLLKNGLPSHQLTANSRRYFNRDEVIDWLKSQGYRKTTVWTKESEKV
ncbi:hypothetical protein BHL83_11955 [Limosilactobacillus reuteri]|uniref:DNA-binding protein n=1 Tax=Limosilactobacillus reuteri TaxID=1598 RepID=A0A1Y2UTL0_LIMRT|nr:DNA-binding protein [Limosilactobacillus reuteri]OTA81010.1 hypothetical protein BHL82_02665 [Limosilactobacillus reuteri]OTA87786.1 hypothetical protein BHL83_11955 [Limosilactobacillus reuteri]